MGIKTEVSLSRLASQASDDLYNLIKNRENKPPNLELFTEAISEYISYNGELPNISASSYVIWWEIIKKISGRENIRNVSDVSLEMKIIAWDLSHYDKLPKERLEELYNFCYEASRRFAAHEDKIRIRYVF
jgi:hypothetical protein